MQTFKIGDYVRFLNQTGEGTIIGIDEEKCYVEDDNGFVFPTPPAELVLIPIDSLSEQQSINSTLLGVQKKDALKKATNKAKSGGKHLQVLEVDLHQQALSTKVAYLTAIEIHELQKRTIIQTLEREKQHHGKQIIFIHGKGDGTLRRELLAELERRKKKGMCRYEDAPFHTYGYQGAIKVTIS